MKSRVAALRAPTYSISELAKEFALTTRAIRFYEDCGLLSPQRKGSARVYGERERVRIKLILRGKRLGLSLAEIGELLDLYEVARNERAQLSKFLADPGRAQGAAAAAEGGHRCDAGRDRRRGARVPPAAEGAGARGRALVGRAAAQPGRAAPAASVRTEAPSAHGGEQVDVYVNVIQNPVRLVPPTRCATPMSNIRPLPSSRRIPRSRTACAKASSGRARCVRSVRR